MTVPTHVQAIIARCTRNGRTSWQNVAIQLGWSVDKTRGLYDPAYLRFYAGCSPERGTDWEIETPPEPTGPEAFKSPYVRPLALKLRVLDALKRTEGASAETVAGLTGITVGCARKYLSVLGRAGMAKHSYLMPYTWTITRDGMAELAVAVVGVGRGNELASEATV